MKTMKNHRRSIEERQAISRGTRRALKKKGSGLAGPSEHEANKTGQSKAKVKRAVKKAGPSRKRVERELRG
jgi:hypothetical protein